MDVDEELSRLGGRVARSSSTRRTRSSPSSGTTKSPFFEALEREFRQQDITDDVAETAYGHYLEQLDEVARLDVVAMFHQVEDGDADHPPIDVLHVIGRTRLTPYAYFYRTRVDASAWTPWQKIDLDIPGN
ncbi:MAG: neuraminidase-like domain-containing protein [Mesorhizobium sp.]